MPKTERTGLLRLIGINLIVTFVLLFSALAALQLIHAVKRPGHTDHYRYDEELGWALTRNNVVQETTQDFSGREYHVAATVDNNGFLKWGDVDTDAVKVLFIGDSFTAGFYVSSQDAYYSIFSHRTGAEVFATGGGGYGTLQELLQLRRYASTIQPDIVVLQFCSNDFINNSLEVESYRVVRNQKFRRPYWHGGKIVRAGGLAGAYRFLYEKSWHFRLADHNLQKIQFQILGGYESQSIKQSEVYENLVSASYEVTSELLSMFAEEVLAVGARGFTFNCKSHPDDLFERWAKISRSAGLEPLREVSIAVDTAEVDNGSVRAKDGGHWSDIGHLIVGESLVEAIGKYITNTNSVDGVSGP